MKKKELITWITKVGFAMAAMAVLCGEPQMILAAEAEQAVAADYISTWTEMNEVTMTTAEDEVDILTAETKYYKPYAGALYTLCYEVNETGTISITDFESADVAGAIKLGELVIPAQIDGKAVTRIENRAFENGGFEGNVVIPDTVTSIGNYAFYYCNLLKGDLVIPDSVTSIGESAFKYSGFDGTLTLSKNLTEIKAMTFGHTNFKGDIVIPDGVTTLGTNAFGSSTFDGRLRLPDTLITIGENAFIECKGLTGKLVIPSSVTLIDRAAFLGCCSMDRDIYIANANTEIEDSILPLHLNYDVRRSDHTIHAPRGSKAEAYAEKYEYTFKEWNGVLVNGEVFEFTDVDTSSWMFEGINYVYQNGIMTGKATDKFDPLANMTRAEFATSLYSMAGKPAVEYNLTFQDVKESDWYGMPIAWAYELGIISGYDTNTFGVQDNITREQIALMLYKYATEVACCEDNGDANALAQFADCGTESSWARKALQWAVTNGVMSGKNDPANPGVLKLDPTGKATRAECATMIKSYKLKVESGRE